MAFATVAPTLSPTSILTRVHAVRRCLNLPMRRIHRDWAMPSGGWMWGVGYAAGRSMPRIKGPRLYRRSPDLAEQGQTVLLARTCSD